ncbi:MAG: type II secretion system protein M [Gammaproteobacteria bacterium]|nr:type II secretion system protein M [Gammaproteobacteria bacterium]MBU1968361.1 type II secretion system protein M [Gammaproteobacteria bacterium]
MNMQERIDKIVAKVDGMSLRERALIFAAAVFLLLSLIDSLFLNPLLQKQKSLSAQVQQQNEKMKEIQAQLAALLKAREDAESSPQHLRVSELRKQIDEGKLYLKERRDKLVPPEKMAELLEQVLKRDQRLQLVALTTLPVSPLVESTGDAATAQATGLETQIYKHGVKITVRGSYADLLQYLSALERLPTQMFWGRAQMNVIQYPSVELTLTLYTLSLDKTWLQV